MPRHTARQSAETRARVVARDGNQGPKVDATTREIDRSERKAARHLPVTVTYDPLWPALKQPGRKFGPMPKPRVRGAVEAAERTSPSPTDPRDRARHYHAQNGVERMTPAQRRRARKQFNRVHMPAKETA